MNRYDRNKKCFSAEDQEVLKNSKVCVLGCGGLGGYSIELLGRIGVGYITAVDGDVFDISNLNRQLYSDMVALGASKAHVAARRVAEFNPEVTVTPIREFITKENGKRILENHDVVIDALDNIDSRKIVGEWCRQLKIPFIYGAIAGWYGQVSTIMPGEKTLEKIYKGSVNKGAEKEMGNPSFTPALVASLQVSEAMKFLTKKGELLQGKILFVNTLEHEYETIFL